MANDGFNGTTISFGGNQVPLVDVNYSDTAAEIDITGCAEATMHRYLAGIPDPTVTFTVVGHAGINAGDVAQTVIAWFDGTTDTLDDMICTGADVTGSLDDKISSSITLRGTTNAA